MPVLLVLGLSSCIQSDPKVLKLDKEYGFKGFHLGRSLYNEVREQVEERAADFDVIEFETFGSRFADQHAFEPRGKVTVYNAPVTNVFAGMIDRVVYALLFQIETDDATQDALQDSLIAHYGEPQSVEDTTYSAGSTRVHANSLNWSAGRVAMEFGRGEGFAEVLVYDKSLMEKRMQIQGRIQAARADVNPQVSTMSAIGDVVLNTTVSMARWQYRFRGERSRTSSSSYGAIDYSFVQPFFGIRGKSLYGVQMAFASVLFEGPNDSLRTLEVEFDNTHGQVVGFMDMLRTIERRLGRHSYSDTLYTIKGPYRRAYWYGKGLSVKLEEHRFRPENPDRADLRVRFLVDRVGMPFEEPVLVADQSVKPDSTGIKTLNSTVSDSSSAFGILP